MLCDGKYDTTTAVGTEVAVDDLGSMFVWIPRFAYKITSNYHSNTTGGIDVKFLKGTSSETDDNVTIVEYNETTTNNYTQFPDGYVVHPAFTNDVSKGGWSTQLTGIWVAKFEAGYPMADTEDDATSKTSDNMYYPVFKGKRYSYNNYKIQMLYSMCESMTSSGNPYSITSSSNSHMIKNSEWGAVAYLTRSSYGKESQIYINNVSFENDRKNINNSSVYGLTGYSADAVGRGTNNVSGKDIGDSITGASYNVKTTTATISCTYENVPGGAECGYYLQSQGSGRTFYSVGNLDGSKTINLSNLKPSTTYYYTAAIKYNKNEYTGVERSFMTKKEEGLTSCPNSNHPHWIDLGLPSGTQWRCCNEGASTPEAYGGYYQFGQVSSAPTYAQIQELVSNCTYQWTTQNGINGGKFTGPNGGSIFLPAAGSFWDGELFDVGSDGYYWSSTPYDEYRAGGLGFNSGRVYHGYWGGHYDPQSVRPVRKN